MINGSANLTCEPASERCADESASDLDPNWNMKKKEKEEEEGAAAGGEDVVAKTEEKDEDSDDGYFFSLFITLGLELSDTKVYEP